MALLFYTKKNCYFVFRTCKRSDISVDMRAMENGTVRSTYDGCMTCNGKQHLLFSGRAKEVISPSSYVVPMCDALMMRLVVMRRYDIIMCGGLGEEAVLSVFLDEATGQ